MKKVLSTLLGASSVAAATLTLTGATMTSAEAAGFTKRVIDFDSDISYPAGTKIQGDEWSEWGIEVEAFKGSNKRYLTIFDSNCEGKTGPNACSGNDDDLGTGQLGDDNRGNVLIIQKNNSRQDSNNDGLYDDPNDDAGGGTIRFDFSKGLQGLDRGFTIDNLEFLDYDKGETRNKLYLTAWDKDGNKIKHNETSNRRDRFDIVDFGTRIYDGLDDEHNNSIWNFDFDQLVDGALKDVGRLEVNYNNISGAISKIELQQYHKPKVYVPEPSAVVGLAFLGGGMFLSRRRKSS